MSPNEISRIAGISEFLASFGEIAGAILGGIVGDKFGKKLAFNGSNTFVMIIVMMIVTSKSITMLYISKLLMGLVCWVVPNLKAYILELSDDTNV